MVSQIRMLTWVGVRERSRHSGREQPQGGKGWLPATVIIWPQTSNWGQMFTCRALHNEARAGARPRVYSVRVLCVPTLPPWEGSAAQRACINFHSITSIQQIEAVLHVLNRGVAS